MTTYLDSLLGSAGRAAFTATTANYTQPAVSSTVTIAVGDSSWVPVGLALFVEGGGNYEVTVVSDATHITIKNLGGTGNAAPAATVTSGKRVTAAGAPGEAGAPGAPGVGIAPVRCVQVVALDASTYSAGAGTITRTGNGALALSTFDLPSTGSYTLGDRVEVNTLGVANAQNGPYTVTALGSGAAPWQLTRVAELNTDAEFARGAAYDVVDGNTYKGTRRQLYTQGAISLVGLTPLTFDAVRERDLKVIDLTKAPYFVKSFTTSALAIADGVDQAPAIRRAVRDAAAVGGGTLVAPQGNILIASPIDATSWDNVQVMGAGAQQTVFYCSPNMATGDVFRVSKIIPLTIFGTLVDTACDQPIVMYDAAGPPNSQPYFDLSAAGFAWPSGNCHFVIRYRWQSLTNAGYIMSTRGREAVNDALSECFTLRALADGSVELRVRIGGVLKTLTKPAATVAINKNYTIDFTYDGATASLYVCENGAAQGAAATTAASGSIVENPWERTVMGAPNNAFFPEGALDVANADGVFGSMRVGTVIATIPATTGTVTPSASGQTFFWSPSTGSGNGLPCLFHLNATYGSAAFTTQPIGWPVGLNAGGKGWAMPRRNAVFGVMSSPSFSGFKVSAAAGANSRARALFAEHAVGIRINGLSCTNVREGVYIAANCFYSHLSDVDLTATRMGLAILNTGAFTLSGAVILRSGIYPFVASAAGLSQSGTLYVPLVGAGRCALLVQACQGVVLNGISIDDEGATGPLGRAAIVASVNTSASLYLGGGMGLQQASTPVDFGSYTNTFGPAISDMIISAPAAAYFYVCDATVTPLKLGPRAASIGVPLTALTNRFDKLQSVTAPAAPGTALTDADQTLTYSGGDTRIQSVVLTANRVKTLSATGAKLGDVWHFPVPAAPVFTCAFLNGGPGAGTKFTASATYVGTASFRFDGTDWQLFRV